MEPKNGIIWDVNPIMFHIGTWSVRWYGLLFALGFVTGIYIVTKMFKREGVKTELVDSLFLYVVIGTVVGARLGHVFFYGWGYYRENLLEIFEIWRGGLASHGAAIGIILALWLWSRKVSKKSLLWAMDTVVVPTALAGAFIRTGNLINSEIYGHATSLPWAFTFIWRDGVRYPPSMHEFIPRHPTQIYEALAYLLIFAFLMYMYWKTDIRLKEGKLFGWFMLLVFGFRFFVEFLKETQEAFEAGMILDMGQLLSIPLILAGLFLVLRKPKPKIA